MTTLLEKAIVDNQIMKILKLSEIAHIIAQTPRGVLQLTLPYEGVATDYWFTLDSVKVSKEINDLLLLQFNGILYTL